VEGVGEIFFDILSAGKSVQQHSRHRFFIDCQHSCYM